jgi:hypothetical protein
VTTTLEAEKPRHKIEIVNEEVEYIEGADLDYYCAKKHFLSYKLSSYTLPWP